MTTGGQLAAKFLELRGHPYRLGAELNGVAWATIRARRLAGDCSEGIERVCAEFGVQMVDGAQNQRDFCQRRGTLIAPSKARNTAGALGFIIRPPGQVDHVVMSLGNGSTIEFANRKKGCGVFNWDGRGFTHAALIPGVTYGAQSLPPATPAPSAADLMALVAVVVFVVKLSIHEHGTVGIGDTRTDVITAIQRGLNGHLAKANRSVQVHGFYTPELAAAIAWCQLVWGLPPSGSVDMDTANRIWP